MEKSSQIAWKIVPLRQIFPLKVVPLIEGLLYLRHIMSKHIFEVTKEFFLQEGDKGGEKIIYFLFTYGNIDK
jgi:hypothetical protein